MRNIGIIVSALSISAGILVGHSESTREARERGEEAGGSNPFSSPYGDLVAPTAKKKTSGTGAARRRPGPRDAGPRNGEEPGAADPAAGGAASSREASGVAAPSADPAQSEARLGEIERLLAGHELAAAREAAATLAASLPRSAPALRARALRLEAKARVIEELLRNIPDKGAQGKGGATSGAGGGMREVLLANGNKVVATSVEKEGDRYRIVLPNGATFSPPAEDVLEVRPYSEEKYRQGEWEKIEATVAKLENSIDLFVRGVQKAYQLGLEKEGLGLLDRLLALPDSDTIPLLFIPEASAALVEDWRVAAGRASDAEVLARTAPTTAASRAPGAGDLPPRAAEGLDEEIDPNALLNASRLMGEAQALYQAAAGKEGREDDLREARKRIDRAFEILESLPATDTVKDIRRKLSTLLSDVVRVSPF
jgi:hypothetical protein